MRALWSLAFVLALVLCTGVRPADATPLALATAARAGACDPSRMPAESASPEVALAQAYMARCLLAEGAFDAIAASADALVRLPQQPGLAAALPWVDEVAARALLIAGRHAEAIAAFDALHDRASRERTSYESRARLLYYRALAREAAGDREAAEDLARQLVVEYPASLRASRVALAVGRLDVPPAQGVAMAASALRGRHYEQTDRLLRAAACPGNAAACTPRAAVERGGASYEAAYQLGFLLYRFRREIVNEAIPWLETVAAVPGPRRADALYALAQATQRMERGAEARRVWARFVREHGGDSRADEAAFAEGALLAHDARWREADDALGRYMARGGSRTAAARRLRAWARYRQGDCRGAMALWTSAIDAAPRGDREARYWRGVCRAQVGDDAGAREDWEALVATGPVEYHGMLAARRLGRPILDDDARARLAGPIDEVGASGEVAQWSEAGFVVEAGWLAERMGTLPTDDLTRARALSRREDWRGWWSAVPEGSALPASMAERRAWRLAWPAFHAGAVRAASAREAVPEALIWAVMRKESAYDPRAISVSDAMGLMQVIPQTALRIAASLGEGYVDGQLFEPSESIRYGAWYLGVLRDEFVGQLPLAAGAYNAGPIAMRTWVDRSGGRPFDEFVEEIAYDQARDYVKKVISFAAHYLVASGEVDCLGEATVCGLLPVETGTTWAGRIDW